MFHPFWTLIYGLIIGFGLGMAVYRNNAKKFKRLEEQAKAKGKSFADLVK